MRNQPLFGRTLKLQLIATVLIIYFGCIPQIEAKNLYG